MRSFQPGKISTAGLVELLSELRDIGPDVLSSAISRHDLYSANLKLFLELRRNAMLPLKAGGDVQWEYIDPNALLQRAVTVLPKLQSVFGAALRRQEPTMDRPWRLVIGFDEFVPGRTRTMNTP